jgi:hypothetical protein
MALTVCRVIRTLEQLGEIYGLPQAIRLDNGPELRSAVMTEWCEDKGIELRISNPANLAKTLLSSALTERIGMKCSMLTSLKTWIRPGK